MRILADENFPRRVIDYLRHASHDVLWAGRDLPTTSDSAILERAEAEGRILFTLDRDFWQLAIQRRERMQRGGVVLIRVHPATAGNVGELARRVLVRTDSLVGQIALVTSSGVDILPAGRNDKFSTE